MSYEFESANFGPSGTAAGLSSITGGRSTQSRGNIQSRSARDKEAGVSRWHTFGSEIEGALFITLDDSQVIETSEALRKIAREGVFAKGRTGLGKTHRAQAIKFWQNEGRLIAKKLSIAPLFGYQGRQDGKPFDLSDTLRKVAAYTIEPWRGKKSGGYGVTVRAGTGKHGKGGTTKQRAQRSLYPERGIAPGSKPGDYPARKWQIPVKYQVAQTTARRFAGLYAESVQAELDRRGGATS